MHRRIFPNTAVTLPCQCQSAWLYFNNNPAFISISTGILSIYMDSLLVSGRFMLLGGLVSAPLLQVIRYPTTNGTWIIISTPICRARRSIQFRALIFTDGIPACFVEPEKIHLLFRIGSFRHRPPCFSRSKILLDEKSSAAFANQYF